VLFFSLSRSLRLFSQGAHFQHIRTSRHSWELGSCHSTIFWRPIRFWTRK